MHERMIRDPRTGSLRALQPGEVAKDGEAVRTPMLLMDNARPSAPHGGGLTMRTVKDRARPILGDAAMEGLADHEIRRKAVAAVLGDAKVDRQPDAFVEGAFRTIAPEEGPAMKPLAARDAAPSGDPMMDGLSPQGRAGVEAAMQGRGTQMTQDQWARGGKAPDAYAAMMDGRFALGEAYRSQVDHFSTAWKGDGA